MNTPEPDAKKANPTWGRWEVLLDEPAYKVKRIAVLPGKGQADIDTITTI